MDLEIQERLESAIDAVLDGGDCGLEPATVVDSSSSPSEIVPSGKRPLEPLIGLGRPRAPIIRAQPNPTSVRKAVSIFDPIGHQAIRGMIERHCSRAARAFGHAPTGRAASGQLLRCTEELVTLAIRVRVLFFVATGTCSPPARRQRRTACAVHDVSSTGGGRTESGRPRRVIRLMSRALALHLQLSIDIRRLARTGAHLQGSAGAAEGKGPCKPTGISRISAAQAADISCTGLPIAPSARTRCARRNDPRNRAALQSSVCREPDFEESGAGASRVWVQK